MQKSVIILGATGTIGQNTLGIIRDNPDKFKLKAITAYGNIPLLAKIAEEFQPEYIGIANEDAELELQLKDLLKTQRGDANLWGNIMVGQGGIKEIVKQDFDVLICAIVGIAALPYIADAIFYAKSGANIGLANKEALVCAGDILMDAASNYGVNIIPIDSEHHSIHQIFPFNKVSELSKIILTSSGGPFFSMPFEEFHHITPEMAVKHPKWNMGRKISVDSATMMNKGLEVIEASKLFPVKPSQIEVLVHPQSIIHGMVELADASLLAGMSITDMRVPISYSLNFPDRLKEQGAKYYLNLAEIGKLEFFKPDYVKFPALAMAYDLLNLGQAESIIYNVVNEIMVAKFLNGEIKFTEITINVEKSLNKISPPKIASIADVLNFEKELRASF